MQIVSKVAVISILLLAPVATVAIPETSLIVSASNQVMWGKTELKVGQLGKVTIKAGTQLVSIGKDGKLVNVRTLKKGDEFRVYSYKDSNGGLYGVGGGQFVQRNVSKVLYETPSKSKLAQLAAIHGGGAVNPPSTQKPPISQEVGGIKALYGNHTYGSKNQAEYDTVIKRAKEEFANYQYEEGTVSMTHFDRYLAGERSDGSFNGDSMELEMVGNSYGDLVKNGVSKSEIMNLIKSFSISSNLTMGTKDPLDGTPRSAYDAIARKLLDCDPLAEVRSLVFDMSGYSTMIVAGNNHADFYVKIQNKWYAYDAGSFKVVNQQPGASAGTYIMSAPTF